MKLREHILLLRRIIDYVRPYIGRLILAMVCMVVVSAFSGLIAFLVKPVLDDIFINRDVSKLYLMPALVVGIYLVKGFFDFSQAYMMAWVEQRADEDHQHRHRTVGGKTREFQPAGGEICRLAHDDGGESEAS